MTKNAQAMLEFAKKYPGWHAISNDAETRKAAVELETQGLIEVIKWTKNNWQFAARRDW
jgi:hypothetical protein